jgi:hypothetical protein
MVGIAAAGGTPRVLVRRSSADLAAASGESGLAGL